MACLPLLQTRRRSLPHVNLERRPQLRGRFRQNELPQRCHDRRRPGLPETAQGVPQASRVPQGRSQERRENHRSIVQSAPPFAQHGVHLLTRGNKYERCERFIQTNQIPFSC